MDWHGAFKARAVAAFAKTFWVNAPQETVEPYATLLDVTELRPQLLNGWDLEFARVQIDTWAMTYTDALAGMEALLAALVPANTANGHTFQRAEIALGPRDVGGERKGDRTIYRRSADLIVAHKAA